jgi:hypothetical protein
LLTKGNFISKFIIALAAIVILFIPSVAREGATKTKEEPIVKSITQTAVIPEAPKVEQIKEIPKPAIVVQASANACDNAVKQVWPQNLWYGAGIVLDHENNKRDPRAIGGPNPNGSFDYGCFQINKGLQDYGEVIFDPVFNAQKAYAKYQSRGFKPWYAVCPLNGSDPYGLCY